MSKMPAIDSNASFSHRAEALLSVALLGVLVVLLVPLPPVLLDMLLATNLGATIILLLVTLGVKRPLDLAVFPSLLLLLTLVRLSLNVATTRLILLDGSAGKIVSAFGDIVVGGNLVVGLVIFLILIIVQFIVITKGAGRVSEVAARFTLDALPGKQMAIDAELNAGSIDDKVARHRRNELARETEFYGAMDGASKFVRGDAIAGLIVTAINLVGGIILGVVNGLTFMEATTTYSILTIGDGLISQIPALIIATSAGILVTKSTSEENLGNEITGQLLVRPAPLIAGAGILGLLSLAPGLPKLPFLFLAVGIFFFARNIVPEAEEKNDLPAEEIESQAAASRDEELVDEFVNFDRACVEVGGRLIGLVDSKASKGLAERIPKLRAELTKEHGLWIPPIRIRDNLQLRGEEYRILINGRTVASGELRVNHFLAINPGELGNQLGGESTTEPTFGLPAMWLPAGKKHRAELNGLTVVDTVSVLITHLGEILKKYAHDLLSREDLQKLLDRMKQSSPTIVEELKPDLLRVGSLHQVLIALLREKVPVSDLSRVVECALAHAAKVKEPVEIAELLRKDLGRSICDPFRDEAGRVRVIMLSPKLQSELRKVMHQSELILQQAQLERLLSALHSAVSKSEMNNMRVALLTDDMLRRPIRNSLERSMADLSIIAYSEIPSDMLIEQVAMIDLDDVFEREVATLAATTDSSSAPLPVGS
jgi:flagellar biosynthesis protein FlhA